MRGQYGRHARRDVSNGRRHQNRRGVVCPEELRFCSGRGSRDHSDQRRRRASEMSRALDIRLFIRLVLLWLVCPCHPQREAAFSALFLGALAPHLRPSTSHSASCEQFRRSSAMRPSGAFRARRCHALARCCASLAFAWNRCASLKTPSSARH